MVTVDFDSRERNRGAKDNRAATVCSPVWIGAIEQWDGDTDIGTK